jgi:hypothetical protein
VDGCRRSFIGDNLGWLFSIETHGDFAGRWLADFNIQPSSEVIIIALSILVLRFSKHCYTDIVHLHVWVTMRVCLPAISRYFLLT